MTREEIELTIEYLKSIQEGYIEGEGYDRHPLPEWHALDKAIELIELLGQEEPVLDKIKNEIKQKCCITVGRENDPAITLYDVFEIIDKYKVESE